MTSVLLDQDIFTCLAKHYPKSLWVDGRRKGEALTDSTKVNNLYHMCWDLAIHVKPQWSKEPWKSSLRSVAMGVSVHTK